MDNKNTDTRPLAVRFREYMDSMSIVDAKMAALVKEVENELDRYQNTPPLQMFAEQQAVFRLNQPEMQEEIAEQFGGAIPAEVMDDLQGTAGLWLSDYLIDNENALNYDGMDDILRGAISDTAARFQKEEENEEER
jgi:hypothetical protein